MESEDEDLRPFTNKIKQTRKELSHEREVSAGLLSDKTRLEKELADCQTSLAEEKEVSAALRNGAIERETEFADRLQAMKDAIETILQKEIDKNPSQAARHMHLRPSLAGSKRVPSGSPTLSSEARALDADADDFATPGDHYNETKRPRLDMTPIASSATTSKSTIMDQLNARLQLQLSRAKRPSAVASSNTPAAGTLDSSSETASGRSNDPAAAPETSADVV